MLPSWFVPRNVQSVANRYTDCTIPPQCNYYETENQTPLFLRQKGVTGRDIDSLVGEDLTETSYS